MHKRTSALILSGVIVTGAVGAVAITPASATTSDNVVTSRLAGIKSALSGLVSDGTLTQQQADKVAGTLDSKMPKRGMGGSHMEGKGGHLGGMGMGMSGTQDAAAKALGMTTANLRTALKSGKSLADVAKDQKVSVDSLVKAMVAAAQDKLAAAVKDGKITQARADAMKSSLTQRITDRVNAVRSERGMGGKGMGMGMSQDAAAKALGMTTADLRTALKSGKSLADVAKDQKVSVDSLVKAMVAAAQNKLAAAVKDGKITQARADAMKSSLTQRITAHVKAVRSERGPGHGPRGSKMSPSTPGGAPSNSSGTS